MTVFLWVFMMNAMDFLPLDIMATIIGWFGIHEWRNVPTADVNTTFALALGVWFLMIFFGIRLKVWADGFMNYSVPHLDLILCLASKFYF